MLTNSLGTPLHVYIGYNNLIVFIYISPFLICRIVMSVFLQVAGWVLCIEMLFGAPAGPVRIHEDKCSHETQKHLAGKREDDNCT